MLATEDRKDAQRLLEEAERTPLSPLREEAVNRALLVKQNVPSLRSCSLAEVLQLADFIEEALEWKADSPPNLISLASGTKKPR